MRLKDKVAVVTGAAKGIGLACAKALAAEGTKVVLADVEVAAGEMAAEELQAGGAEALFVACDVGDKAQVDALIGSAVAAYGRLDCAVANAGIVYACDFLDLAEEDFDRVLRINLKGVFLTGQAAARQMVAQGTGGTVINMSSVNAVMAIPSITPYVVAKGGVNQLTKVMALALADKGIRVNAIGPGSIMTEVFKQVVKDEAAMAGILSRTPLGRVGEPEEVAKVAVFLASEDSSYITGQTIYPDGGRLALNYTVPVKE
ncbi:MAG: SDR family oxidoreductase [Rhodospirillales bacterium]|nr:SDR family oxidoreductase [Rhodospirillales bacterium]MDH3791049.1 SDR family oxidoreductase [Rhodospirillales bacterium]MDH3911867.1 SDR family oxidoreductase [Rhodospirillales bacterium]MDH3970110.1 SDR family oxidoreductase [Rhodospirillales bacterium]